jgi:hypothetical protein
LVAFVAPAAAEAESAPAEAPQCARVLASGQAFPLGDIDVLYVALGRAVVAVPDAPAAGELIEGEGETVPEGWLVCGAGTPHEPNRLWAAFCAVAGRMSAAAAAIVPLEIASTTTPALIVAAHATRGVRAPERRRPPSSAACCRVGAFRA